jgi:hypothetical protein
MIVMFSARRLKPGSWEQFRRAWDPGDTKPPGFQRAYHARNIRDEDEVISFGLFDMTEEEYREGASPRTPRRPSGLTACRRSWRASRSRASSRWSKRSTTDRTDEFSTGRVSHSVIP